MYKRRSFCGPAGYGPISKFLSLVVNKCLDFLSLNFEKSCKNHDIDWDDGPKTIDDIRFALSVYSEAKEQKGAGIAWLAALIGFIVVILTAIVYKLTDKKGA
jgi:hypothetical protein